MKRPSLLNTEQNNFLKLTNNLLQINKRNVVKLQMETNTQKQSKSNL